LVSLVGLGSERASLDLDVDEVDSVAFSGGLVKDLDVDLAVVGLAVNSHGKTLAVIVVSVSVAIAVTVAVIQVDSVLESLDGAEDGRGVGSEVLRVKGHIVFAIGEGGVDFYVGDVRAASPCDGKIEEVSSVDGNFVDVGNALGSFDVQGVEYLVVSLVEEGLGASDCS